MKAQLTETRRTSLIVFIILGIVALSALTSCQKSDIPEWKNIHSISFEPGNEETYTFSDHHPDSLHKKTVDYNEPPQDYTIIKNGYQLDRGIKYDFWIEGNTVFVKSFHPIIQVRWYPHGATTDFEVVEVDVDGVFKHRFSNHSNSDGYFIVQIPFKD